MRIFVDCSNLREGGGVTHILELFRNINNEEYDENTIITFGNKTLLDKINIENIEKIFMNKFLNSFFIRIFFQLFFLPFYLKRKKIDILFAPGGTLPVIKVCKYVTMSRNMLMFDKEEKNKYSIFSFFRLKLELLKFFQILSLKKADGIIFLSNYAKDSLIKYVNKKCKIAMIPHGVSKRFKKEKKENIKKEEGFLYISTIDYYKNQIKLIEAFDKLNSEGIEQTLILVGQINNNVSQKEFFEKIKNKNYIKYLKKIEHEKINEVYQKYRAFIFASTCENFPNILMEAMQSEIPILSAQKKPMTEILENGAVFFDVNNVNDIKEKIKKFLSEDKSEIQKRVKFCKEKAETYTWEECASKTIKFLKEI